MKTIGRLLLALITGLLITLFASVVILDISNWFNITFISNLSIKTVAGCCIVINLIHMKITSMDKFVKKKEKEEDKSIPKDIAKFLLRNFGLSLIWGYSYLIHLIFENIIH